MGFRFAWCKVAAKLGFGGKPGSFLSIAQVCRYYKVSVITPRNLNSPEFLQAVKDLEIDLVASVAAPQIFRQPLIELPKFGCINIHNSPLPKYRGMLPNFWQMYHGESQVGTTIHRINAKLDDGAILLQRFSPIERGETLDSLMSKTKRLGAHFMMEAIALIQNGKAQEIENTKEQATYFTFPTKSDVREFRRRGYRIL
jgi:methionyl-tRNA formyltransferase